MAILLVETFGLPFLKNTSNDIGSIVGCIVAGAAGYIDASGIKSALFITFCGFVHLKDPCSSSAYSPHPCYRENVTFSTSLNGDLIDSLAREAIGDTTASAEVPRAEVGFRQPNPGWCFGRWVSRVY